MPLIRTPPVEIIEAALKVQHWAESQCAQPGEAWAVAGVQSRAGYDALQAQSEKMKDAAEMLWVVLANVSEGDWTKQSQDWQEAAARQRDNYHSICSEFGLKTA